MHGGLEDVMSLEFILQRGVAGVLRFSNILTISLYCSEAVGNIKPTSSNLHRIFSRINLEIQAGYQ